MTQKIDLHTHTTASDGSFTPTALVEEAIAQGLSVMAITDHDTIDGLEEAESAAEGSSLHLVRGCELSTSYGGYSVHVLGLFLPKDVANCSEFMQCLELLQKGRSDRNLAMLKKLNAVLKEENLIDDEITFEEVKSKSCGKNFGRGDFATVLEDRGIVTKESKEAYTKYVGKGAAAYVSRKFALNTVDAVKALHATQALVVIAHPVDSFTSKDGAFHKDDLEKMVEKLKPLGLTALEAYHSKQSEADCLYIKSLAEKHGLKITGGSDFHGARKSDVKLGYAKDGVLILAENVNGL